ncbi:MAG: COG1361 S-layer family protein [Nitrososphaerales archaeon]
MNLKLSFDNELYKSRQRSELNFTAFLPGRSFVEVALDDRFLIIGATNPLSFEISNVGSAPLYQVTATLSIVTGRVATTGQGTTTNLAPTGGNARQFFSEIGAGERVQFPVEITIDPSVAESSMTAVLTLRYTDVTGTNAQESHNLGLVTTGAISMILQDASMTPRAGFPGANVSLSGTILNQGNEPALYTSISLRGDDVVQRVRRGPPSDQYIGQIDPNTPLPFSLNFRINPDITPGRHQVTLVMEFQTNYLKTQTIEEDVNIFIRPGGAPRGPQTTGDEDSREFGPLGVFIAIILASFLGGLFLYRRSKRKPDDFEFDNDDAVS